MGRFHFPAEGRAAENELPIPEADQIGQVGMAAGELRNRQVSVQPGDAVSKKRLHIADIEIFSLPYRSCLVREISCQSIFPISSEFNRYTFHFATTAAPIAPVAWACDEITRGIPIAFSSAFTSPALRATPPVIITGAVRPTRFVIAEILDAMAS